MRSRNAGRNQDSPLRRPARGYSPDSPSGEAQSCVPACLRELRPENVWSGSKSSYRTNPAAPSMTPVSPCLAVRTWTAEAAFRAMEATESPPSSVLRAGAPVALDKVRVRQDLAEHDLVPERERESLRVVRREFELVESYFAGARCDAVEQLPVDHDPRPHAFTHPDVDKVLRPPAAVFLPRSVPV